MSDTASTNNTVHQITLGGKRFNKSVDGERIGAIDSPVNVIIVNAAKLARTYYKDEYDPRSPSAPTCWSPDTQVPSVDVPTDQIQSARCMDCPQNIKGSSGGGGRACRFSQRLAILLEGQMDTVYQIRIPATSIFGNAKDGNMGMQAYAKYLHKHKTPSIAVVTQMRFDDRIDSPKLFFKAVRALEEQELQIALKQKSSHAASIAALQTVAIPKEDAINKSPFTAVDGFEYNKGED